MKKQKSKYKLKRRIYLIFIILFAVVALGVYYWYFNTREVYDENNLPTKFVSYEFVSSRPEARLYYPGSREYHRFGESSGRAGYAIAGVILTSNDSQEQIYNWYRDWLTSNGWRYEKHAFAGLGMSQDSLQGYVRGEREKFYIAMDNPSYLSRTLGKKVPSNATVFEINYFINPKPTPTPSQEQFKLN